VQTFLPYSDFDACAAVLDDRRLGKQRVEALQILRAITVPGYGWRHHPAVAMWRGREEALAAYGVAICREWCGRGRRDTCEAKIRAEVAGLGIKRVRDQAELPRAGRLPPWLGDEAFHRSRRSSLLRKDPDHYGRLFADVSPDLPYVWPAGQPAGPAIAPGGSGGKTPPMANITDLEDEDIVTVQAQDPNPTPTKATAGDDTGDDTGDDAGADDSGDDTGDDTGDDKGADDAGADDAGADDSGS